MSVFALIISGCIFQFNFFLKNAFGLYFFTLELFALSLIPLAFLVSAIVKKASNATSVGFLVFILGYFLQLGNTFTSERNYLTKKNFTKKKLQPQKK
jgi:hypothetical protein